MFYDIFTKKRDKEKNIKLPEIIIDTREKQSLVPSYLSKLNANFKFEHLDISDYLIGNIAIERKTFSDFISSIINQRLFQQLKEIKKYPSCFLIIEGKAESENKKIENASKGMILSVILDYKIPIIFTKNEEETAEFIFILAKRIAKPKTEKSIRFSRALRNLEEQKQFILEGFQGIGPKNAKKLIKEYKTLNNIFLVSEEQLKKCIGECKSRKFRQILED